MPLPLPIPRRAAAAHLVSPASSSLLALTRRRHLYPHALPPFGRLQHSFSSRGSASPGDGVEEEAVYPGEVRRDAEVEERIRRLVGDAGLGSRALAPGAAGTRETESVRAEADGRTGEASGAPDSGLGSATPVGDAPGEAAEAAIFTEAEAGGQRMHREVGTGVAGASAAGHADRQPSGSSASPSSPSPSPRSSTGLDAEALWGPKTLTDLLSLLPPSLRSLDSTKSSLSTSLASTRSHLSTLRSSARSELSDLSVQLSRLTGYAAIDVLKAQVMEKEAKLVEARQDNRGAKVRYEEAVKRRAGSMREVNDLLSRKASWTDGDLARFTTLVRADHANEQAETEAKQKLDAVETRLDADFTELQQAILKRYHEEQIWSDKIRSLSTTFSLSITVINVLVFLLAIVFVEPYKRAKVVEGVETRMVERDAAKTALLDRALGEVVDRLSVAETRLESVLGYVSAPPPEPSAVPHLRAEADEDKERERSLPSVEAPAATLPVAGPAQEAVVETTAEPPPVQAPPSTPIAPPTKATAPSRWFPLPFSASLGPYPEGEEEDEAKERALQRQREQEVAAALGVGAAVGAVLVGAAQLFWR